MDIRRKDEQRSGVRPQGGASAGSGRSSVVKTVLVILVVAALVVLGFYFAGNNTSFNGPVAIVNGQEIPGSELKAQLDAFRNSTSTQAEQFNDLSDTRQQEILLEGIINTRLQLQAAEAAGVTVSDEEVEAQLQERIDQIGEDTFKQRLKDNDVTRQEVRDDLRNQMIINAFIQQTAGGQVAASATEVQNLYDQYVSQVQQANASTSSDAIPTLSELRPQIEAAVIQQKQQQIALQLLEQARQNAEVEVLIEGVSYPATTGAANANTQTQTAPTQPTTEAETGTEATPTEE